MADKALYSLLIDLKADTAKLQRDMTQAVGILQRSGRLMNNVMTGIAQGLGQAFGQDIIANVGRLSTAIGELADRGDKASAIIDNFRQLGGSADALKKAQAAVLGTVNSLDLMRAANEGLIRGIPNLNQNFAQLAEFANRFADATGQETVPVLNQLIDALATGKEKGLKPFGFELSKTAEGSSMTSQALDQLGTVMAKLAPLGDSVTASHEAFTAAMSDALDQIGIGINDSEALAQVYRDLSDAIDKIDWKEVGDGIAGIAVSIASVMPSLKSMTDLVTNLGYGLQVMTKSTTLGKVTSARTQLDDLNSKIANEEKYANGGGVSGFLFGNQARIALKKLTAERDKVQGELATLQGQLLDENRPKTDGGDRRPPPRPTPNLGGGGRGGGGGGASSAAAAARELQRTQDQFRSFLEKDVRNSLSDSIKNLDQGTFDSLKEKLRTSLEQSYVESNQQFVDSKLMSMDELTAKAKQSAQAEVDEYAQQMAKAYDDREERERRLAEEQIRAAEEVARIHQQAVASWRGFYDQLFSGGAVDYKQSIKELATGFASELSAGLFGELKNGGDIFFGLGQMIATGLGSSLGKMGGGSGYASQVSSIGNYIASAGSYFNTLSTDQAYGMGMQGPGMADGSFGGLGNLSTDQAHSMGIQGPGGPGGQFNAGGGSGISAMDVAGVLQAGMSIFSAGASARKTDKANGDNSGTGGAVGAGAGAAIGMLGGPKGAAIGAQIGQLVGGIVGGLIKRGPQNKQTQARHTFANWMEDFLSKERFTVMDRNNGNPQQLTNFLEGSSGRFNSSNWADNMKKQSAEVQNTFKGLGLAIKELLGITEDVADQFGFLLGENLQWNINNARHLFKQMNLSVQEVEDKLVEMGRKGKMSWLQVEQGLQATNEAAKPGLVEQGAYGQAFQNTLNSGGIGFAAIQGLRDLGVELKEAGVQNFEQMKQLLLQKGFDEKSVNALVEGLKQRGVMTPEQLASVSDRVAGGIIADMDARGAMFKKVSDSVDGNSEAMSQATGTMRDAIGALQDLTNAVRESNGKSAKSYAAEDQPVEAFATGGVVLGPKRGLMGENGPEAILPLTRRNGKLGVVNHGGEMSGGGTVIHIDARGATPGVENRIRSAMKEAEDRAVRRMLKSASYASGRTR